MYKLLCAVLLLLILNCECVSTRTNSECVLDWDHSSPDRRPDASRLRLAHFNAEWLFSNCSSAFSGCPWTEAEALAHISRVANYLDQLDADLIHLAEVHDCATIELLLSQMNLGPEYSAYLVPGMDTATGQNVALLSRVDPVSAPWRVNTRTAYPLEQSSCGYERPTAASTTTTTTTATATAATSRTSFTTGTTKHLFARFELSRASEQLPPVRLLLLGLHLLAHPTDPERCAKREAQAQNLVAELRAQLREDEHLVILGDFNDFDETLEDAAGSQPISRVLFSLRELWLSEPSAAATPPAENHRTAEQRQALPLLQNVFSVGQHRPFPGPPLVGTLAPRDTYSAWWDKNGNQVDDGREEHTSIDHILLSNALVDATLLAQYEHAFFEQGDSKLDSDHWPLLVELNLTAIGRAEILPPKAMPPFALYALVAIVLCMILILISMTIYCVRRYKRRRANHRDPAEDAVELMSMDALDEDEDEDDLGSELDDAEADASLSRYERWKKTRERQRAAF